MFNSFNGFGNSFRLIYIYFLIDGFGLFFPNLNVSVWFRWHACAPTLSAHQCDSNPISLSSNSSGIVGCNHPRIIQILVVCEPSICRISNYDCLRLYPSDYLLANEVKNGW